ncbi:glycosyltransferase [Cronobacter sp. EKM101R]|uniref:ATP-grasp fold amidoligase family protein n=1 Tax=Cronobacter TaxID=413496 RepID=UPI0013EB9E43|nr:MULTISPECIES: ATP-grasp fold amidoligase family protein [Cronobacter]KAF6590648.1 glycosyltransferase [Cronobacter sp. EKM101R]KAF6593210.1 glycosyltransferase [Cronobacter sp. EKM102R]MDK1184669.1 ATP-grasp fold amidoligase family protein [Cronobacter turicensis]MDK1192436.1 ATP-grasp fold amidoligase family protein [Cronobacter dublinensis]MDK1203895.1 ATP-grasp fold amidoligase family protein [Cronobacter dublinensis]
MFKQSYKIIEYQFRALRTLFVSDENYRRRKFKKIFNKELNLSPPSTLNEKINYRMIFERDFFFTIIADKIAVRNYVEMMVGNKHLVPLLAVFDSLSIQDLEELPDSFVMKCNHDSGSAIICHDKSEIDKKKLVSHFARRLRMNPYYTNREWQYKNIKPQILVEKKLNIFAGKNQDITPEMFRVHCFHKKPMYIEADFTCMNGRQYVNIYDAHWKLQPFTLGYGNTPYDIERPCCLQDILDISAKLATCLDYCRVDLMVENEWVYFSEITLTPESGQLKFCPAEWDLRLGCLWDLPVMRVG